MFILELRQHCFLLAAAFGEFAVRAAELLRLCARIACPNTEIMFLRIISCHFVLYCVIFKKKVENSDERLF